MASYRNFICYYTGSGDKQKSKKEVDSIFEKEVKKAEELSDDELLKKIASKGLIYGTNRRNRKSVQHSLSEKKLSKKNRIISVAYDRDADVSEYAKRRAVGYCDLCEQNAPFVNDNNIPYLEVHHIKWLSDGGADTLDNVSALCPNCHRKMHIRNDLDDKKKLQQKVRAYMKCIDR